MAHSLIMMNQQLTRQGTLLQVALLVGKCASWIAAKLNIHKREKRGIAHGVVESLLTCIHISLTTNLGVWVLHDSESAQPIVRYFSWANLSIKLADDSETTYKAAAAWSYLGKIAERWYRTSAGKCYKFWHAEAWQCVVGLSVKLVSC